MTHTLVWRASGCLQGLEKNITQQNTIYWERSGDCFQGSGLITGFVLSAAVTVRVKGHRWRLRAYGGWLHSAEQPSCLQRTQESHTLHCELILHIRIIVLIIGSASALTILFFELLTPYCWSRLKIFKQIFNRLPWNLIQIFMGPRGWILLILMILWLFLWRHHVVHRLHLTETCLTFTSPQTVSKCNTESLLRA